MCEAQAILNPSADDRAAKLIDGMIAGYKQQPRSPILKTPASQGLDFEELSFPSEDGTPLEAWFIPKAGSDKLIVVNHPRYFSRYGFPSHLDPWKQMFAIGGNTFEIDFNPDFRILNEAGYNILAYDLRNLGHSGAANGGITTGGIYEARDVIGSLAYARSRPDLAKMRKALFSRCLGCNATIFAMARRPDAFEDISCMVGCQPLSPRRIMESVLALNGIPSHRIDDVEQGILLATSVPLDAMSPIFAAAKIQVPTFLYQVKNDALTRPADVQAIFDAIPTSDKDLFWIEGSTRRWDGYTYFQKDPSRMLAWFERFI
jgi:uncharacterized protein